MTWVCKSCRRRWTIPRKYCPVCGEEWVPACANVYIPTKEEIRAKCAEIQAGWSAKEEQMRRASAHRTMPVEAYEYHVSNVADGLVHRKADQLGLI